MKKVIIASSSEKVQKKIQRLLMKVQLFDVPCCRTWAEAGMNLTKYAEGILIVSCLKNVSVEEIKERIPVSWDLVYILSPGMPTPFYSSNLTVFTPPVSAIEFTDVILSLLYASDLRHTQFHCSGKEAIQTAKIILMKEREMSEEQAHRYLQRMSMTNSESLEKTAEAIIKSGG